MAQESEKRFHQIMDKLFTPSKSPLPSSSTSSPVEQQSRGKKRPCPSSALSLVEPKTALANTDRSLKAPAISQSGLCRPWDRGDLMRRLATFKSMTWFAKPQVIGALNCARRGWVNDDTDTISCESCGAHLYFSAPASWSKQQVEKAASVFSLKLDNGHKLLCPWIENSCEETLSEFPSMTPQDLVERHGERSEALLQLFALPVISPSAIDYMKSSDLEEFLKRPIVAPASGDTDCSQTESLINHVGATPAQLFYQAQKLISLCGWEPRALPYIVDCKDKSGEAAKGTDTIDLLPETATRELLNPSNSTSNPNGVSENSENSVVPDTLNSDPSSVVLDCKLCGACVGLWVFSTVPRPLELCRVTGDTEVNTEKNSRDGTLQKQTSSLKFTIAGGPPATKQNFKATISLPIVGRNLRSRFASYSRDRDHGTDCSIQDQLCKTPERNGGGTESSDLDMIDVGEKADGGRNAYDLDSNATPQTKDKQLMLVTSNLPENNKTKDSTGDTGKSNKQMEFDPIKQHRHFCPWIWSTGRRGPGWRQTLSALQRHKGSCQTPPSPSSIFKVDDPLTSVRNLFKSPSPKRARLNRGSSS
ncbi:unnamed protein product [Eruca vesicaria subsp. sativa]|uniref:C3HC-type domain-containing protein n=1 Tax=Eruca vesicaria subsp. sativa TaxID=29727 RepID=A0ABC8L883_ERUVS|nr:unnamed protein product [Eruca vesicaria subsp. sativa]